MYVYLRQDPSVYRNLHISNKVGIEVNASTSNSIGNLGLGIDLSKVSLTSNNLGNRNRTMLNMFIEQQIKFQNEKIDLTPGIAITYFSDVSTRLNYQSNFFNNLFFYPGMDLGYRFCLLYTSPSPRDS